MQVNDKGPCRSEGFDEGDEGVIYIKSRGRMIDLVIVDAVMHIRRQVE